MPVERIDHEPVRGQASGHRQVFGDHPQSFVRRWEKARRSFGGLDVLDVKGEILSADEIHARLMILKRAACEIEKADFTVWMESKMESKRP
jgi:hypothetical protein